MAEVEERKAQGEVIGRKRKKCTDKGTTRASDTPSNTGKSSDEPPPSKKSKTANTKNTRKSIGVPKIKAASKLKPKTPAIVPADEDDSSNASSEEEVSPLPVLHYTVQPC